MWYDAEDVDRGVCATPCAGACNCGTKAITVGSTWFTEVPGVVAECDVYDNWDPRSCDAILEDVSRYTWAQFVLCCCILASSLVLAGTLIFIRLSQPSDCIVHEEDAPVSSAHLYKHRPRRGRASSHAHT